MAAMRLRPARAQHAYFPEYIWNCTPPKSQLHALGGRINSSPCCPQATGDPEPLSRTSLEYVWAIQLRFLGFAARIVVLENGLLPLSQDQPSCCLLYTSDAADDLTRVDL